MTYKPWLHHQREGELHKSVFAFELDSSVRQRDDSRDAAYANRSRQMDFINALHQYDEQRFVALRYIFLPGEGGFLSARTRAVLLSGCVGSQDMSDAAHQFSAELTALLGGSMPEGNWRKSAVAKRNSTWRVLSPVQARQLNYHCQAGDVRLVLDGRANGEPVYDRP